MKNKMFKRIISFVMAVAMSMSIAVTAYAEDTNDNENSAGTSSSGSSILDAFAKKNTYSQYYDNNFDKVRPDESIVINGEDYDSATEDAELAVEIIEGIEALVWKNDKGSITYKVDVKKAGIYNFKIHYYALAGSSNAVEIQVLINGELPYDVAERVTLPKRWVDEKPITSDAMDNDIRPKQVEFPCWQITPFKDNDGLFNEPLIFYLEEGVQEITIQSTKAKFAIDYIEIYNEKEREDYQAPSKAEIESSKDIYFKLEGEQASYRSDVTLYATYDRTTYLTSPSSPTKMRYNTIGADVWKSSGQSISWEFTMEESGWVKIGIRARQQVMRGFYSNRRLYIDGEVPNAQAAQLKFYYSTDWEVVSPTDDDGNVMYFYLEAGKHTITLEAIPGEIGDSMRRLDEIVYNLNNYYRRILQITGPTPDPYTTYNIHTAIPSIIEDFKTFSKQLKDEKKYIEKLSKSGGSEAISLEKMAITLDRCVKKPSEIPSLLGTLKDYISSVSAWMREYRDQPLEVDFIEVTSADKKFTSVKKNFWESIKFSIRAFIGSFFEDYNTLSVEDSDALNVWVGLGRDQAQVIKELVDSIFVPQSGIKVNINLVQGGVLEATLAGKGPDISLFTGGDFPIQLAARNVLVDLTQFDDYEEVTKRFTDGIMTHYTFNKGVYGLPINQSFSMLFYRTDVLEGYGFDNPPDTWDELIEMLPVIQRNYGEIGIGDLSMMLMLQQGINLYNEEQTATNLDTLEAVTAFETWTKFYTTYSFPISYDGFSRFRTGEMPLLIAGYTFYNQLAVAAPEIKGLWDFTTLPGTRHEDGTINYSTNSGSSGAIIFNKLNEEETKNAWEFIKWFTDTEAQFEYGTAIESLLGPLGRFDTANTEALKKLSWSQTELEKILAQRERFVEIPILPSSYIVSRSIASAFSKVVNNGLNARDTLIWYNKDINAEILRKRKDLGIDK